MNTKNTRKRRRTSVFVVQINEDLDVSRYLGFIDQSVSMIRSDELIILIIERENRVFKAENRIALFNVIHDLLSTLYIMSENSKKRHNKADLEVNIVFNEWCGYELFSEQKNWDKIYTLKDDKPLIDRISSLNSLQSRLFILSDQPASQEFLLKKGAKRCVREPNNESFGYKYVAVGGTFDHLHAGHKILLAMSAWISEENVVCGVTGEPKACLCIFLK